MEDLSFRRRKQNVEVIFIGGPIDYSSLATRRETSIELAEKAPRKFCGSFRVMSGNVLH